MKKRVKGGRLDNIRQTKKIKSFRRLKNGNQKNIRRAQKSQRALYHHGGLDKMKKLKLILKKCFYVLAFCLGVKGSDIEKEAIKNNLVSREGQGRDKYGN